MPALEGSPSQPQGAEPWWKQLERGGAGLGHPGTWEFSGDATATTTADSPMGGVRSPSPLDPTYLRSTQTGLPTLVINKGLGKGFGVGYGVLLGTEMGGAQAQPPGTSGEEGCGRRELGSQPLRHPIVREKAPPPPYPSEARNVGSGQNCHLAGPGPWSFPETPVPPLSRCETWRGHWRVPGLGDSHQTRLSPPHPDPLPPRANARWGKTPLPPPSVSCRP